MTQMGDARWECDRSKLTLLQNLGAGQFGTVNKMVLHDKPRPGAATMVAVKTLLADAPAASEAEFLAEMQLMMKLRHPNLVNLLGIATKDDPLLLVLEFLPGGSLDKWLLAAQDVARDDQLYILYQVALGMDALHARGILHRDLAARNVLVGVDLVCKVSDYGLSREVTEERDYYRHRTDRAVPLRWMAPEVRVLLGLWFFWWLFFYFFNLIFSDDRSCAS
jgi:serine/threonine protein kinase